MSQPAPQPPAFGLTPRQRRLRTLSAVILVFLSGMIILFLSHPFFHHGHPLILTEMTRRAVKIRLLLIGLYITVMFLLVLTLVLLAWLDVRETRLKALMARRDMWKEIAERSRERRGKPSDQ